ncbi:MAG: hypothetical protein H6706_12630 [Myxococcales bacterium]|nr:hypothetical protein [Myxococcales bacterium]
MTRIASKIALLTSMCLVLAATPAVAQVCPEGRKRCNGLCITEAETCQVKTDSNNFFILGLLVAVGAIVGVSFWLNPTADMQKDEKTVGHPPLDFHVTEDGGGLMFRTEW